MTIVIPTFNEERNIGPLVDQLVIAVAHEHAEILFVDDSNDGTPAAILAAAENSPIPVRLLHREGAERTGGLGGAVVAGLRSARYDYAVVMDGDLQHPPTTVPVMMELARRTGGDVVVASRYVPGGNSQGLANASRRGVSAAGTRLVKTLFPRRLNACTDPMTGFFAVRRESIDLDQLRPNGFKILLEILARNDLSVHEVPMIFAQRLEGESKANMKEGFRFLQQVLTLRIPASLRFLVVGASGVLPNLTLVWLLSHGANMPYLFAAALGTQAGILWNFTGAELFIWHDRRGSRLWQRLTKFVFVSQADLIRLPLVALLVEAFGFRVTWATAASLVLLFGIRFVVMDRVVYRRHHVPSVIDLPEMKDA